MQQQLLLTNSSINNCCSYNSCISNSCIDIFVTMNSNAAFPIMTMAAEIRVHVLDFYSIDALKFKLNASGTCYVPLTALLDDQRKVILDDRDGMAKLPLAIQNLFLTCRQVHAEAVQLLYLFPPVRPVDQRLAQDASSPPATAGDATTSP
jgi:hypothetical protein